MDSIAKRTLDAAPISTLAALAAQPGPQNGCRQYIEETDAQYEFVPGDVTAVDGWTSIAPTGGTAGRWLLRDDRISIAPLGANADDWVRLHSAQIACSYKACIEMRAGTWLAKTVQNIPRGTCLRMQPGTSIISSIAPSVNVLDAPFSVGPGTSTSATTFAAANTVGAKTISSTVSIPAGSLIQTNDTVSGAGLRTMRYTVASVAGGGPFTLTLDRPVLFQYANGDQIAVFDPTTVGSDIIIEGNGATVTGTGTRIGEFVATIRCRVQDLKITRDSGLATDIVWSFDVGGYENRGIRIDADGGATCADGLALESQERSTFDHCNVNSCTSVGIILFDCLQCDVIECNAWSCDAGLGFSADGSVKGSFSCRAVGGSYNQNTTAGISVVNGCVDIELSQVTARFNGTNISIGDPGSTVSGTIVAGARCDHGVTSGCTVSTTARRTLLRDLDASDGAVGLNLGAVADVDIEGYTFTGATAAFPGGFAIVSSAAVRARGCKITPTTVINVVMVNAGRFDISESQISGGNGSNCFNVVAAAALLVISKSTVTVGGGGTGITSTGRVRVGEAVDLSGSAIPLGGAGFNLGQVQLTANAAVPVAFADLKAEDRIVLDRIIVAGGTGLYPLCVKTPGTGFTLTSVVADTDTYQWRVV